jgi:hypothetical protein
MMTPMGAAASALFLVAGLGGLAYLFIWHPIQRFLGLREEIRHRIAKLEKERARRLGTDRHTQPENSVLSKLTIRQLRVAEQEFHKLAVRVKSFAETQHAATWVLRQMQFDLAKAEAGLSGLAAAIALERDEHLAGRCPDVAGAAGGQT